MTSLTEVKPGHLKISEDMKGYQTNITDCLNQQVKDLNATIDNKTGEILEKVNSGHDTISEAMKTYQTDLIGSLKKMQDDSFGNQKKLIKLSVGLICGVVFLAIEILVLLLIK
jgi:hypothetical protein